MSNHSQRSTEVEFDGIADLFGHPVAESTELAPAPIPVEVNRVPVASRFDDIFAAIEALADDSSDDALAEAKNPIDIGKHLFAELERLWKAKVIARIKASGANLSIPNGDGTNVEYFVGKEKVARPRDPKGMLGAMLDIAAGDLETVNLCLSSAATTWKQGAVAQELVRLLGDKDKAKARYDELYETTWKESLDKNGEPKLNSINEAFVRKGAFTE